MKKRPARALLKASVLVVSESGTEGILVKPRKPKRSKSWELPGGKIDEGESLPAGACREVLEETGARVQLEAMVALYKCMRQDELMFLFLGRWADGELQPDLDEIGEVRWEPLDRAAETIRCPLNRQRIHDCVNFSGSPLYRLIRKRPFETIESWDLGPASLEGFEFLSERRQVHPGQRLASPSPKPLRWWPFGRRRSEAEAIS